MIYITKEQAQQVKYLLEQAMQGNHILFDSRTVSRVMTASRATLEASYGVEPHIEKIMSMATLPEQRAYLERLDPETFELVVKTYIHIVENTLFETKKTTH